MLLIGSVIINEVQELLENYTKNGTVFQIIRSEGLNISVLHNLENDAVAKALVKQIVGADPKIKSYFLRVKIIDENGTLI